MNKQPTLSAIIIVWNGIEFLPECLNTLVDDLKNINYEIIIIDNASTDGSLGFITDNYPQTKLVCNKTNLGFAKAVNQGIETSHGEYLYILNQDLRFQAGATSALLERIQKDNTLGMIGPAYVGFDGHYLQRSVGGFPGLRHLFYHVLYLDRFFSQSKEFGHWRMSWFDHQTEMLVDQPMGAVMMIPRIVIDRIGLFDEQFPILFNDVDYCKRMELSGFGRLYYPLAVVEHYVGGSTSRMPYKIKKISHFSMYRYLKKYSRWHQRPLLWLAGILLMIGLGQALLNVYFQQKSTSTTPSS